MDYCIETDGLSKVYEQVRAVDGLSLRVEKGSFYGFLGPNGAGKSTTIKVLTGITAPTSGDARILGYNLGRSPLQVKRRIGVVPEGLCLFENLTAREYLSFIARMYRLPAPVATRRCGELLELLGLADTGKTLALEFSHGMKKKLCLAAALIHDPELLFLDEPFEGIDVIASRTIRAVLDRMIERGASIFLTSHVLEIVERLCTHVGIIREGRMVKQGLLGDVVLGNGLEAAFVEAVGHQEDTSVELSWLGGRR